jgi:ATP-dependent Clp protease ATP-binding subunit ClpC
VSEDCRSNHEFLIGIGLPVALHFEGLFDLAGTGSGGGVTEAIRILEPHLSHGVHRDSAKEPLEKFHGVVFGAGAIRVATAASRRFLFDRQLPDRVIDLLDEVGARARMRRETESAELIALRQRIRRIAREVEGAIANFEFEKDRQWAEEERSGRRNLSRLRDEIAQKPAQASTVTPEDILEVVAELASVPVASVRQLIEPEADGE